MMTSERARRAAKYAPPIDPEASRELLGEMVRTIGDKKAELKAMGLPSEDLSQVIEWAKEAGIDPDDMTFGDLHEWAVSARSQVIAQRSLAFFDAIDTPAIEAEADPASEFEGMLIGEDDLLFLQVAADEGAVNGVCKKSNTIYRKATGLPECPRELRNRLKSHGLIDSAQGKGITVLPKGERYVKLMSH